MAIDHQLLSTLCAVRATSGDEGAMTSFILDYVKTHQDSWVAKPEFFAGDDFQDCIILIFGQPRTAIYAHIDSIGFTVRYDNKLVPIGGPEFESGYGLVGADSKGEVDGLLVANRKGDLLILDYDRDVEPGTALSFKPNYQTNGQLITSPYMDNRAGVYCALKVAETLKDGALVFSCYEEHKGGTVAYLAKFLFERYNIRQSLIADITWETSGVHLGKGPAISLRDSFIPRKKFLDRIRTFAIASGIPHQLEVEGSGGSDGSELQRLPYPIDWCFIGAAEQNVHSPSETIHATDLENMIALHSYLIKHL